jgi:hypothetical protein
MPILTIVSLLASSSGFRDSKFDANKWRPSKAAFAEGIPEPSIEWLATAAIVPGLVLLGQNLPVAFASVGLVSGSKGAPLALLLAASG